jgi:hypothetical protein
VVVGADRRRRSQRSRVVLSDPAAREPDVAFYDEKVDVYVDGVLQERPKTKFS